MRVLVLTADLPPRVWSGVGRAVACGVRALHGAGFEVVVGTSAAGGMIEGVRVEELRGERFPEVLRRCEVVHLHSLRLAELAMELKRRDGSRLVYTAHSTLERELGAGVEVEGWKRLQERVFAEVDHVVFLSTDELCWALRRWPWLREKASVMGHGLGPGRKIRERRERGLLMFGGRFCASKGIDLAVDAMTRVMRERDWVRCVFAGGRGDGEEAVRVLRDLFPERCCMTGWLDEEELTDWLERAEILLMPSRYEPFGMMALEAMRAGMAVLGSGVGGLAGIGCGVVAEGSVEAWAGALDGLLEDEGRARSMGENGAKEVAELFGLPGVGARYEALLRGIVCDG